jgi:hypothetical protein
MKSPILILDCTRYYRDGRHWDIERINKPSWTEVEVAVRRMENYCFPIVHLNTTLDDEEESIFNIIGGAGRWALLQMMGDWQYTDRNFKGEIKEEWLWESDQGYGCKSNNILTDIEKVLRIVRKYYDTGSYAELDAVQ